MTEPGAPAPDGAPTPQIPAPWPPQQQAAAPWPPQQQGTPAWPAQQGPMPPQWQGPPPAQWQGPMPPQWQGPPSAQWQGPPSAQWQGPPPPRTDSTRTIAILAMVTAGLALLGVAASTVVPLLFGLLLVGFGSSYGDVIDDGSLMSSSTTYLGGHVDPAADGSVAGPTLAGAVVELVADNGLEGMSDRVSCDPVAHVGDDASVLCRATDPTWFGIVRFSGSDGSFDVLSMGGPDGPMP